MLLEAKPGDQVLDLCAGAGGKSLQLAAHVAPAGRVHAYDIDRARLDRLRHRASRAGATISIHDELKGQFDRILLDAPCSELGALRRGPDLRWRLDPATFDRHPGLPLCERALTLLRPHGRIVFATCTFRREENEDVVDAFMANHPTLRRTDFKLAPHTHGTDAFFAAVIE